MLRVQSSEIILKTKPNQIKKKFINQVFILLVNEYKGNDQNFCLFTDFTENNKTLPTP